MAEKEERTLHIVQKLDGRFVGESRMPRQEAIERIAKAFFPWDFFPHEIEEGKGWKDLNEWQKGKYLAQAKNALDALLER